MDTNNGIERELRGMSAFDMLIMYIASGRPKQAKQHTWNSLATH